jgi:hypothetical protein
MGCRLSYPNLGRKVGTFPDSKKKNKTVRCAIFASWVV